MNIKREKSRLPFPHKQLTPQPSGSRGVQQTVSQWILVKNAHTQAHMHTASFIALLNWQRINTEAPKVASLTAQLQNSFSLSAATFPVLTCQLYKPVTTAQTVLRKSMTAC